VLAKLDELMHQRSGRERAYRRVLPQADP